MIFLLPPVFLHFEAVSDLSLLSPLCSCTRRVGEGRRENCSSDRLSELQPVSCGVIRDLKLFQMSAFELCACKVKRYFFQHNLSRFLRKCSSENKYIRKWKNRLHIYSYSFNWGSLAELSHLLAREVIFNKDGLVVINKPYGVGKESPIVNEKRLIKEKKLALVGGVDYYLKEILPLISRKLNVEYLDIIKIPERYTSGVTILSTSAEISAHLKECIKKGKGHEDYLDTYRLVCVGQPAPLAFKGKVAITFEEDKISRNVLPVLARTWSKNAVKKGDVKTVIVEHSPVNCSSMASLLEVKTSRTKAHFLRMYMAYMLSPILGDNLYGSRVQKIGSTPVAVNPFCDRAKMPQHLEDNMLKLLDLQRKDEIFIPTHIHLHKVTIPDFYGKNQPLHIEAPVSEFFQWTCKRMHLTERLEKSETEMSC